LDIGARCAESGHQSYTARDFFLKYSDRILLGADLVRNLLHFAFWKPTTSFFNILPIRHARAKWNIYGVFLPDEVLHRVYKNNAKQLVKNFP
jgi:predicted TIM-barrel fold metal-dependent hydrolase